MKKKTSKFKLTILPTKHPLSAAFTLVSDLLFEDFEGEELFGKLTELVEKAGGRLLWCDAIYSGIEPNNFMNLLNLTNEVKRELLVFQQGTFNDLLPEIVVDVDKKKLKAILLAEIVKIRAQRDCECRDEEIDKLKNSADHCGYKLVKK